MFNILDKSRNGLTTLGKVRFGQSLHPFCLDSCSTTLKVYRQATGGPGFLVCAFVSDPSAIEFNTNICPVLRLHSLDNWITCSGQLHTLVTTQICWLIYRFWIKQILNKRDTYLVHQMVLVNGRCDLKHVCLSGRGLLDLAQENQNTSATLAEVNICLCYTVDFAMGGFVYKDFSLYGVQIRNSPISLNIAI